MLHRSFKPAKCKTSLKLLASRTKLLKNKKEVVVKQLRRELAQLLESGQDQNARIRVEHVVREEKMMAAYELIELFSELIALRLPVIESQKNCPIDLKEAVTSVIFASPRCSDIPELADVRKHFTAKYGKEFVSAAIELRPDCGVNRQLVEKLSTKAPDGQTKLKILTAIAEEHNIKWEPKAFGEKDANPHEDLLNGPKTFGNASNMHVESSNVQASYYDQRIPDIHSSPQNEAKQEAPVNYHGDNVRSSLGSQNVTPADANASAAPSHHRKPSGNGMDRMESGNLHFEDQSPNFVNRQNWNMEFKDATAAAEAAAESAERASMAARAAAELSSRGKIMTGQSTGSEGFPTYARDEMPRRQSRSSFDVEAFAKGHIDSNFDQRSSRSQNEEISDKEEHNFMGNSERIYRDGIKSNNQTSHLQSAASPSDSFKGNKPSSRPPVHGMGDGSTERYSGWNHEDQATRKEDEEEEEDLDLAVLTERLRGGSRQSEAGSRPSSSKNSSGDFVNNTASSHSRRNSQNVPQSEDVVRVDEFSMRRQSEKFEEEPSDETKYGLRTKKAEDLEDERFRKDFTSAYSYSGSPPSNSFDNRRHHVECNSQKLEDADGNPFANFEEEKFHEGSKTTNDGGSVVFDNYDSDGENSIFDLDKGPETSMHVLSPDRKWTSYLQENVSAPSPRRSRVDLFGENISKSHSLRGHTSDSVFSKGDDDVAALVHEDDLPPAIFDDAGRPQSESEDELENLERDQEDSFHSRPKKSQFSLISEGSANFDDQVDEGSWDWPHHSRASSAHEADDVSSVPQKSATLDDSETPGQSSYDDATELSFGKLTGGLRNKGYRHPPYVRSSLAHTSSSRQETEGEAKKSPVSSPPKTTSPRSEIADGLYDQDVSSQKQSTKEPYRSSFSESSAMRKSSEDTAKKSFSSATHNGSIDSDAADLYTQAEGNNNRSSGRVEEKSIRSSSDEAPFTKQAVADSSTEYGLSGPQEQMSGSRLVSNYRGLESAAGKRSSPRESVSSYDSEQNEDIKEEVVPQVSSSRTRYGAGLSRRTKGSPLKTDRSSAFKPSPVPEEEETQEPLRFSSRSSYSDGRSKVKSAYPTEEGDACERRVDIDSSSSSHLRPSPLPDEEETRGPLKFSSRSSYSDRKSEVKSAYPTVEGDTGERRADVKSSSRSSHFKPSLPSEEDTQEPSNFSSRRSYNDRRSELKSVYPTKEGDTLERRADVKSSPRRFHLKPSLPSEEETREPSKFSSRSSYTDRRSEVKSAYPTEEVGAQERRAETKSSSRSSYTDRRSEVKSAYPTEEVGAQERRAETKSSSRSSYSNETYRSTRSERTAMDTRGSSDRLQPGKQAMERPKSELRKSADRPSDSPQMSGSSGPSESSKPAKPSLQDTSRENSFNKASHVHPKLPDYDTIAAQLEALRANRK